METGREARAAGEAADGTERGAPFVRGAARRAGRAAVGLKKGGSRNGREARRMAGGGSPSSEDSAASGLSGSRIHARGRARSESVARLPRRRSECGKRRQIAYAQTLHECARPPSEWVGASPGVRGAAHVETWEALLETRDAVGVPREAPGRVQEALRSRGQDPRGISRSPRGCARARSTRRAARRGGRAPLARAWGAERRVREARETRTECPGGGRSARPAPRASRAAAPEDRSGGEESRTERREEGPAVRRAGSWASRKLGTKDEWRRRTPRTKRSGSSHTPESPEWRPCPHGSRERAKWPLCPAGILSSDGRNHEAIAIRGGRSLMSYQSGTERAHSSRREH